jgi:coenzyme Q-binding protein COQ10
MFAMPMHAEKRVLPYAQEQMFDLVADVERYPEFLPWCMAVRVLERNGDVVISSMEVGFTVFRESFTTRVTLSPPGRIDVAYFEGPFKYLNNHWGFEPDAGGGCRVDFFVDFEFRSRLFGKVIGVVFNEAVQLMVSAFEKRARSLYEPIS